MSKKNASLSIIVPAYNEEKNLKEAVEIAVQGAEQLLTQYEILIFDDGSKDRTGAIADELARNNPKIKVIHNGINRGFGYNYRRGVELASCEYVTIHPGDNEHPLETVQELFAKTGLADIVIAYHAKPHIRGLLRRLISDSYTRLINMLFGLEISYYNGPNILRRIMLQRVPMTTDGFAYMTEILVQLVKSGASFVEVPFWVRRRKRVQSKAFRLSNIQQVLSTVARLWWRIMVQGKRLNLDKNS